jgi:hypothetical protein
MVSVCRNNRRCRSDDSRHFLRDRFFGNAQFDPSFPDLRRDLVRIADSERRSVLCRLPASFQSLMFGPVGRESAEANFCRQHATRRQTWFGEFCQSSFGPREREQFGVVQQSLPRVKTMSNKSGTNVVGAAKSKAPTSQKKKAGKTARLKSSKWYQTAVRSIGIVKPRSPENRDDVFE